MTYSCLTALGRVLFDILLDLARRIGMPAAPATEPEHEVWIFHRSPAERRRCHAGLFEVGLNGFGKMGHTHNV